MTPLESLHYAIGELAYAVARADGSVQKEERKKFHDIVAAELRCKDYAFDVSDIIFQMMDKDKTDSITTYKWAMDEIRLNSHYLSPELKKTFISVMEKVAKAFPPVTVKEQDLINKFKKDIVMINGDPVYYAKT
jgi:uncharacterized tellurite resistance protein B-like protein